VVVFFFAANVPFLTIGVPNMDRYLPVAGVGLAASEGNLT